MEIKWSCRLLALLLGFQGIHHHNQTHAQGQVLGNCSEWVVYLCARASSSVSGKSCSSTLSQRSRQLHSQSGLTTCRCRHSCAWRTFSVPVDTKH
jgi:hypothetical protein